MASPGADGPICRAEVDLSARRPREWDGEVARIASRQHGLVTLGQLEALGMEKSTVQRRAAAGRLHRIHHGVYAVGHLSLTHEARLMAAVLACGPDALLSHSSAAALWQLRPNHPQRIDVTAANRRGRSPAGIRAHRPGSLRPSDRDSVMGVPCTGVSRTLLDFATIASTGELRKAVSEAEVLRLLDQRALRHLIRANRGRRGVARLRMILDDIHPELRRTRSEMERRFLGVCGRLGLPEPEVNVRLHVGDGWLRPDFLWRAAGLILEADSRRFHDTDSAFQLDRVREQRFQVAGWRVTRCTWEQIDRNPHRLAKTIRTLLTQPSFRRGAEK